MVKPALASLAIAAIMLAMPPSRAAPAASCDVPVRNAAAVAAGKRVFIACASCHGLGQGRSRKIGPQLGTMFDGKPLSAQYNYSPAFRKAAPDWTETGKLDAFLARPSSVVPGTKMVFAGLSQEKDRRNVIAYLKSEVARTGCK